LITPAISTGTPRALSEVMKRYAPALLGALLLLKAVVALAATAG
jgi:hypothetical protein